MRIFKLKIVLAILTVFCSVYTFAKINVSYDLDNPIVVGDVKTYFEHFSFLFNRSYNIKTSAYTINIKIQDIQNQVINRDGKQFLIQGGKEQKQVFPVFVVHGNVLSIDISPDFIKKSHTAFEQKLTPMLLFAQNDISATLNDTNIQSLQWIFTGFERAIKVRDKNPLEIYGSFPIMNTLVGGGGTITYRQILYSSSFSPKDGAFYDYYQEESQVLLNTLLALKNGHNFIKEYIQNCLDHPKDDAADIFDKLLAKYKTDFSLPSDDIRKDFNKLLNKTCYDLSINPSMPLKSSSSLAVFERASSYYDAKDRDVVTISNLYSYIRRDSTDSEKFLDQKVEDIRALYFKLNFMLLPPIKNIVNILIEMKNGKEYSLDEYAISVNENISEFKKLIDNLSSIETQLNEVSKKYETFQDKYGKQLEIIGAKENLLDKIWPDLSIYMKEKY